MKKEEKIEVIKNSFQYGRVADIYKMGYLEISMHKLKNSNIYSKQEFRGIQYISKDNKKYIIILVKDLNDKIIYCIWEEINVSTIKVKPKWCGSYKSNQNWI